MMTSKVHFHFEENENDGLLIVFICDGQSDSISINIVISIDRLVVYTTKSSNIHLLVSLDIIIIKFGRVTHKSYTYT